MTVATAPRAAAAPSTTPPPNAPLLIDAADVQAWYGSSHILRGVQMQLAQGETLGLLGRNGMGKSTLIRTLLGHVKQRSGRIHINGRDLSRAAPHEVAQQGIAYVPEGRGIFPNLTVRENLVMAARLAADGSSHWTYDRTLQTFPRLSERLGNLGSQLSGGEQQMLSIGRALMTHPKAIILDEATEGLAPLIVDEIWRVIATIRDSGIATIVVDRDYRRVLSQADRVIVLQKGQVVMQGTRSQVQHDPALGSFLGV
jgi:branched-chain amino acid transport system ATP-binding protein